VVGCAEAWIAFLSPAHPVIPAALAVLGVTLALIGPGEWSVDARLYGWKHFVPPELWHGGPGSMFCFPLKVVARTRTIQPLPRQTK
jgi:hypothetical protein